MAEKSRRGCLKTGCLGCLGLGGLSLVVVVLLLAVSWCSRGPSRIEQVDQVRELPRRPATDEPVAAGIPELGKAPRGRIVLDVSCADFELVPGEPGSSIRLDGTYDSGSYALEEQFAGEPGSGWEYRLEFGPRGLLPIGSDGGVRLRLTVPPDVPIALEGKIGIGESDVELGGLQLVDLDIYFGIGEHTLGFTEPLAAPLEHFLLDSSIGNVRVLDLGNASPKLARVQHSLGALSVDLQGGWSRDAELDVRCGIGSCQLQVPDDVNLVIEDASVTVGEVRTPRELDAPSRDDEVPTLRVSVHAGLGEVQVDR